MRNERRGNLFGIISLILTVVFWGYATSGFGPNAFTRSPYVVFMVLPGILIIAALASVAGAFWGTKWWLLALLGPASGTLLLFIGSI